MQIQFSEQLKDDAARIVRQNIAGINPGELEGLNVDAAADFCTAVWPTMRDVLESVKRILPFYLDWLVDAVIAVIDQACESE